MNMTPEPLKDTIWYADELNPEPTGKFNAPVIPLEKLKERVDWLKNECKDHSPKPMGYLSEAWIQDKINKAFPDLFNVEKGGEGVSEIGSSSSENPASSPSNTPQEIVIHDLTKKGLKLVVTKEHPKFDEILEVVKPYVEKRDSGLLEGETDEY